MSRNPYEKVSNDRTYRQNVHVRVAEEKLGRRIGKSEIVHHIDEDKTNNDPENLLVFRTKGDHTLHHAKIETEMFQTRDGSFVVCKVQRTCPHCERLFEPNNNRNVHCSLICSTAAASLKAQERLVGGRRSNKDELEEDIGKLPLTKIGDKYGVSDNAVRRWARNLGIEVPRKKRLTTS